MGQPNPFSFPVPQRRGTQPTDPESLFRSLNQRAPHVQHLWAHQADVLRSWHSGHVDTANLALELPTGTGKTLIGLLIADFVRQTKSERVAYLCPNRQLAYQVGKLADQYAIDARVLVGRGASYDPNDFNAYEDSSAVAVTTYSGIFNTNPRIDSPNLLILDDAHASENYIASLWNVEVSREEHADTYLALLDLFKDAIPGSQFWNLKNETTPSARSECGKIPSPVFQNRQADVRDFLDSSVEESDLKFSWQMIRDHLDACHVYITWPSISIRPVTPPTSYHLPFSQARQRIYMSATLGEGGELERITGVRRIERLPVPEGWDREGTGRRYIMFPDRSLPPETAASAAIELTGERTRSLILAPSRSIARSVSDRIRNLNPRLTILSAHDVEDSIDRFLEQDHAALLLSNRYDGLDLPGEACHLELIWGFPGATNAQESFLLNRLQVHSLLRDRIKTRLTQALGRCTRNATDHAVVIMSGPRILDFCTKSENRSGFHPELQAEIRYGLAASEVQWPEEFVSRARAFLNRAPGWERADEWIREERNVSEKVEDGVAHTLMANVRDEVDFADAMWVGNYQRALEKARDCADRLAGPVLADYRAWWYYLAASAATLSAQRDHATHLRDTARDLFGRARAAAPRTSWFLEATRLANFQVDGQLVDDPLLLNAAEAVEKRIQQIGVAGAGFEAEAKSVVEQLGSDRHVAFEQGLERLGWWLGLDAFRPDGQGVPDGIWSFAGDAVVTLEAKSEEVTTGSISVNTARQARGHIEWVKSNMQELDTAPISSVIISDRTTVANEAMPHTTGLFVVSLTAVRELGQNVISTVRALRTEASETSNETFRRAVADRLKAEQLDPKSILARFQSSPLDAYPVQNSGS